MSVRGLSTRLRDRMSLHPLARSVGMLVTGTVFAQALVLLASPVLSRLYTPAQFGVLSVFMGLVSGVSMLGTMRYEMAIALPKAEEKAHELVRFAVRLCLLTSTLMGVVVVSVLLSGALTARYGEYEHYFLLLPLGMLGAGLFHVYHHFALRERAYGAVARVKVTQSVGWVGVSVGGGFFLPGAWGLLCGFIVQQSLGFARLQRIFRRSLAAGSIPVPGTGLAAGSGQRTARSGVGREYRRFSLYFTSGGLLNLVGTAFPAVILALLYGATVAGSFGFAHRLISAPMALIGMAVGQVFLGEASLRLRESREVASLFRSTLLRLCLPAGAVLAVASVCPFVFPIVFGAAWQEAGVYAAFLGVSAAGQLVVAPVSSIAVLRDGERLQFGLDALRAVVVTLSLSIPWALDAPPSVAVFTFSAGMIAVYGISLVAYRRLLTR